MNHKTANPSVSLWEKSCALYALPGASAELLGLQDRCGADVPLLLWAAVLALEGEALDGASARAAWAKCTAIAESVRAVRVLRRKLTDLGPPDAIAAARSALLASEQALERLQLDCLAGHRGLKACGPCLQENLETALAACGCVASPQTIADLARLFERAFRQT